MLESKNDFENTNPFTYAAAAECNVEQSALWSRIIFVLVWLRIQLGAQKNNAASAPVPTQYIELKF
jgi:hypothetical protein